MYKKQKPIQKKKSLLASTPPHEQSQEMKRPQTLLQILQNRGARAMEMNTESPLLRGLQVSIETLNHDFIEKNLKIMGTKCMVSRINDKLEKH